MEYKVCDVGYFMDKMQDYELELFLKNINATVKNDWTLTREVMWSNLQAFSKKKLKPKDIMTFPWEKDFKQPKYEKVTKEVVEKEKQRSVMTKQQLIKMGVL